MTIWTLEPLHESRASLNRLARALDTDLPKQRRGESGQSTIRNLYTAAALGVQEVIIIAENGEAVGIASVRHNHVVQTAAVRLLYVVPGVEAAVADMLIQEAYERVWREPDMRHLEAEVFVDQPPVRAALTALGLQSFARQHMQLDDLTPFANPEPVPPLPSGFTLTPWLLTTDSPAPDEDAHLDAIADLIIDAYRDTIDEALYPGLNTRPGLRQFFSDMLAEKHAPFDPMASRLIYDVGEQMVGQIFCSRTPEDGLLVLEIAVRAAYRGHGLGRILLHNALHTASLDQLGYARLQVTLDNPARHLYESLGFRAQTPFWVYVAARPESTEPAEAPIENTP